MPHWPLHPRLAACRRVFLKSYALPVRIGVHDFERLGPQRLLIDVDLYVPLAASTPCSDRLDEVVDYDFIRHAIAERVAQGHIGLQETLCDEIAARMLAHPQVRAVRVSTEKPDVYADCAAVGVEVFHIKESDA
ncbi:MAG: dihydroneopterin aldolase [Methylibium sp.]|nr:dihydroneopterin aldolase [Methylibium sp.]